MTHVLSVIHYPVFGGPHNRNMRMAPILAEHGIKTTVLLPDEPGNAAGRLRGAGVEVVQMPLRRLRRTLNPATNLRYLCGMPDDVREIRKLIERLGIDLVQLNGVADPQAGARGTCLGHSRRMAGAEHLHAHDDPPDCWPPDSPVRRFCDVYGHVASRKNIRAS